VTVAAAEPPNAVTVDVEDWLQSVVDPALPVTDRFRGNTRKLLEAFAARGVRGTFFVLGLAAEKAPDLVREIQQAGHEVQSHGYGHRLITSLTPEEFRADVVRSKKLLEDLTGHEVCGYRAPAFTITLQTLWALDILAEAGFRYDSSVFPIRMPRYGIRGAPHFPHKLKTPGGAEIVEIPVASYRLAGRRIPTGGGGYFRLLPYPLLRGGIRQLNDAGHSATIYMHPYEFAPGEIGTFDHPVRLKTRLHQGLCRGAFAGRVQRLLSEFRFGPVRDVIASIDRWPVHTHAAAGADVTQLSFGSVARGAGAAGDADKSIQECRQ